jgi:hypothetical protein
MSHFIIEHRRNGDYIMEMLSGVEDIDASVYRDLLGIWVCDSMEEMLIMEKQLQEMRHGHKRSSQPA